MVIGAPNKDNGGAVYAFTLQGEKWQKEIKLSENDGASGDYFGGIISISGDTLIVGDPGKDGQKRAAYEFFLAGD